MLESKRLLTPDEKDNLELICRCAYEEDCDIALVASKDLSEASAYDMADYFVKAACKNGIELTFKSIELEVQIR